MNLKAYLPVLFITAFLGGSMTVLASGPSPCATALGDTNRTKSDAAQVQEWFHYPTLFSKDDVQVDLDFQVREQVPKGALTGPVQGPSSFDLGAINLWVHVKKPDLKLGDEVKIVFINYSQRIYRGQTFETTQTVEEHRLWFADSGRFTLRLDVGDVAIPIDYQLNDGYALTKKIHWQEVAILINGQWYKGIDDRNLPLNLANHYRKDLAQGNYTKAPPRSTPPERKDGSYDKASFDCICSGGPGGYTYHEPAIRGFAYGGPGGYRYETWICRDGCEPSHSYRPPTVVTPFRQDHVY